jgi:hypothetical protein
MHAEVNITISNNTSVAISAKDFLGHAIYVKTPSIIGTGGAKGAIYVSRIYWNPLTSNQMPPTGQSMKANNC